MPLTTNEQAHKQAESAKAAYGASMIFAVILVAIGTSVVSHSYIASLCFSIATVCVFTGMKSILSGILAKLAEIVSKGQ